MKEAEPSDYPNELRVKVINTDTDDITDVLGIPQERVNYLMDNAIKHWNEGETVTDSLVKISRLFDNANEFAFVMITLGKLSEKNRRAHEDKDKPSKA